MKRMFIYVISLFIVLILFGCKTSNNISSNDERWADLVVYGTIYTAEDENDSIAEAFAVKDGKYICVGNKEDVKQFIKEGKTEIIDKTGYGLIIPGCTEGHSHYFGVYGVGLQFPCFKCSYQEMLDTLKNEVNKNNIKQFVSFGWDSYELIDKAESGYNFAEEIENIAPNIPVVLMDGSGHSAVCNTTALKQAGLLENPNVRGGEIFLDTNGNPSGYVNDQAIAYILDKNIDKPLTEEQYENACLSAMNMLLKFGYTNALDAYTNQYDSVSVYKALKKMDDSRKLTMNVAACYNLRSYDADSYKDKVDEVVNIVNNYSSSHFNPAYIKLFVDGVVESGTGWISKEYNNVPKGKEHGNIIWNQDELNAITSYANSKKILIHSHSYGDAACKSAIDAYIYSNSINNNEFRNCLAHVRNVQIDDIVRAADNKIPVSENLIWHTDFNDNKPNEKAIKDVIVGIVGEELYYDGYPMKTLLDNDVIMSSSTDAPAAEYVEGNILNVIEIATTGISPNENKKAFSPDELISVKDALKSLTINGAWQLGLENERGSIKIGKYADFVILDTNFLDYEGEQLRTIHNTKILNTYFEGKAVYSAQ